MGKWWRDSHDSVCIPVHYTCVQSFENHQDIASALTGFNDSLLAPLDHELSSNGHFSCVLKFCLFLSITAQKHTRLVEKVSVLYLIAHIDFFPLWFETICRFICLPHAFLNRDFLLYLVYSDQPTDFQLPFPCLLIQANPIQYVYIYI